MYPGDVYYPSRTSGTIDVSVCALNKYGYGPIYQTQIELYGSDYLSLMRFDKARVFTTVHQSNGVDADISYRVLDINTGNVVRAGVVKDGMINLANEKPGMYVVVLNSNNINESSIR